LFGTDFGSGILLKAKQFKGFCDVLDEENGNDIIALITSLPAQMAQEQIRENACGA
jgi:hypothetical protein